MTDTLVLEIALQAMTVAAKMAAPVLLTALAVGFAISLFQSVTQIQEATLSFVPKAVVAPLKNGEPGSLLVRLTLADGRVLGNGGATGIGAGTTAPAPPAAK